jgi:hypothetical protein
MKESDLDPWGIKWRREKVAERRLRYSWAGYEFGVQWEMGGRRRRSPWSVHVVYRQKEVGRQSTRKV